MSKESPGNTRRFNGRGQNRDRDKRFFETIQSALGSPSKLASRKPRDAGILPQKCAAGTLTDALKQITISNEDTSSSLAEVKPIILQKADQLTKEEFTEIATTLCESALEQTNIYFVMEITTELIEYHDFQFAVSERLKEFVGKFLCHEEEKFESIPNVLAQFMINRWPRKFNRAVEGSNLILFTIFNTIIGWIKYVTSKCKTDDQQSVMENEEEKEDQTDIFLRCIQGMLSFCNNGQRFLWLNYPGLFDDIYNATVSILVSNIILPRSVKSSLLNLYQQLGKWSQVNTPKYLNATTQTVRRDF